MPRSLGVPVRVSKRQFSRRHSMFPKREGTSNARLSAVKSFTNPRNIVAVIQHPMYARMRKGDDYLYRAVALRNPSLSAKQRLQVLKAHSNRLLRSGDLYNDRLMFESIVRNGKIATPEILAYLRTQVHKIVNTDMY